jgi:small subunit ribosomal protein S4
MARRMPGPTGVNLLQLLERRLDSVVYRLGFAPTRPMARQLVSHRHVLVNGRPVSIPSYLVKMGDTVALDETAQRIPEIAKELQTPHAAVPHWLERSGSTARVVGMPERQDVAPDIREDLIVEFYAR